jgi:hypothetical protein
MDQKSAAFSVADKQTINKESDSADSSGIISSADDLKLPKAFKFGQVDRKLLMSRLYSTPYNKATTNQKYVLDMGATSVHKPHIKKLENPPPPPEPIVINRFLIISFFDFNFNFDF